MNQPTTPSSSGRMPRQIPYIIANEGCERFSFYGMRNILTPFLISTLLLFLPESERTGEANNQRSVGWGDGIYRSDDGGRSWRNMGLKDSQHIGRIVVDRLSTGFSEATTRLMIQLELVGLSRLGPSPLQLLKDNITGYQLLRDRRSTATNLPFYD